MKKLSSLSAAVLVTAMAWAQDTIPLVKKTPGSSPVLINKIRDTIPAITNNNVVPKGSDTIPGLQDTALLSQVNKMPDTSINRNSPDKAISTTDMSNRSSQDDSAIVSKKIITDRVIMKDDKIMVIKNGDSTLLQDSVTLESGAVVMKNGSVVYTSGKTVQLKNGQYISFSNPVDNNSQGDSTSTTKATTEDKGAMKVDKASATESNSNTNSTAVTKTGVVEDKIVMKDDKVVVIKNGDSTLLQDSIKLKSGAVVKKDASVKFKDGTSTKLKNGQYIAMNPPPVEGKKSKKAIKKKEK